MLCDLYCLEKDFIKFVRLHFFANCISSLLHVALFVQLQGHSLIYFENGGKTKEQIDKIQTQRI